MSALAQRLLQERKDGLSEAQIAEKYNLATIEVRCLVTSARIDQHMSLDEAAHRMAEVGHFPNIDIANHLGLTESEVRTILLRGK